MFNLRVKAIYGTHKWGLYRDNQLVSEHPCQNNALDARFKLLEALK